jgi:hypothetical protein
MRWSRSKKRGTLGYFELWRASIGSKFGTEHFRKAEQYIEVSKEVGLKITFCWLNEDLDMLN